MKRQIIIDCLKTFFATGILICMGWSLLIAIAMVVALCIGGEISALICEFIKKIALKLLYIVCNILAFAGVLKMYLCGEKSLTMDIPIKKKS